MAHKRTEIREALKTKLATNTIGANVYTNRAFDLNKEKLPAIIIRDGSEDPGIRTTSTRHYIRRFNVQLEVLVSDTDPETALDNLCNEIESLLFADITLGGATSGIDYQGTEEPSFEPGSKSTGSTTINFQISYLT